MDELYRQENIIFGSQGSGTKYKILFGAVLVLWTVLSVLFLYWGLLQLDEGIEESARIQARTAIEKDILYRRWNAMHGGVYGPVGQRLLPNPYLDAEKRDVMTDHGQKLTMINPAYMTRQVHELGEYVTGVQGHITSLKPIRPENKADEWEAAVLAQMEKEPFEATAIKMVHGQKYLRMMHPLVTESSCLKCHRKQGYKVGDIRGGLSVLVPLSPLIVGGRERRMLFIAVTSISWLLGCLAIWGFARTKKAEIIVRVNEKKYRTLIETMSEGIVILDSDSKVVFCNPPFASMLGYDPGELSKISFQDFLDEDSCDEYSRKIESMLQGKVDSFELNLLKRTGGQVTVLFSPRIIRGELWESIGLQAVTTDISSIKKMEQEIMRQQRLSSVGMLAGELLMKLVLLCSFWK